MGRTSFNNVFYLVTVSKISFQHVINIKITNDMFEILNIHFCIKALEIDVYFTFTALLNSYQPHRKCSITTCSQRLPVWTAQPWRISLVLPATGNEVVLEDSELGALDLSFHICERRVTLPVLWPSQGCFQGLSKSSALITPIFRILLRNDKTGLQNGRRC